MSKIKKIDIIIHTHIIIDTAHINNAVIKQLKNMFIFDNPLYKKKKQMGFWVGNTKQMINTWHQKNNKLYLPRSSYKQIEKLLIENKYVANIVDKTTIKNTINFKLNKTPYDYQNNAVKDLLHTGNGIVRGPCGCGKTAILLIAISKIRQPTLIIVHSTALLNQWKKEIISWFGVVPGIIQGKKIIIKNITIAMQKTLWLIKDFNWSDHFGLIVGDEIHHWGARTFRSVINKFGAKYRIGCSVDERRKDGLEFLIYSSFGPCVHKVSKEELIKKKKLLPIKIELYKTDFYNEDYIESIKRREVPDWSNLIDNLTININRNNLIIKIVKHVLQNSKNKILILNDRVSFCKKFYELLKEESIKSCILIGGQEQETENSINALNKNIVQVGIGTKVADEFLDIPSLTHIFVTCPVHNNNKRLEQMTGRSSRIYKNKKFGYLVYFWDCKIWPYINGKETPHVVETKVKKFIKKGFYHISKDITIC